MRRLPLLLLAGCASFQPVGRTIRTQDLAMPERTRLTARFTWDQVGDKSLEQAPPGTSPEAVTDEAVLASFEGRLCVHFTMRTGAKHDAPFGEWGITLNGEPVFPIEERSGQSVVTVQGERTVLDASAVGVGALQITAPTTDEYAIIQRTGWFCPTRPPAGTVSFQLQRSYNSLDIREGFVWTIVQ